MRGTVTQIPNTGISARMIQSKEGEYKIFEFDEHYIYSVTEWKTKDQWVNLKFGYMETPRESFNLIRYKLHKNYSKYIVESEEEITGKGNNAS